MQRLYRFFFLVFLAKISGYKQWEDITKTFHVCAYKSFLVYAKREAKSIRNALQIWEVQSYQRLQKCKSYLIGSVCARYVILQKRSRCTSEPLYLNVTRRLKKSDRKSLTSLLLLKSSLRNGKLCMKWEYWNVFFGFSEKHWSFFQPRFQCFKEKIILTIICDNWKK